VVYGTGGSTIQESANTQATEISTITSGDGKTMETVKKRIQKTNEDIKQITFCWTK